MNLFSRMVLLGTLFVALSLPMAVTEPAAAVEGTIVKSGGTPQLATRADHPSAYKTKKKRLKKKK